MAGVKQANRRTLKVDIRDTDWARLAAYIDGEGCVNIHTNRGQEALGKSRNHSLKIHVTNTDPRLPVWIFETFGVGKCRQKQKSPSIVAYMGTGKKWRQVHIWQVEAKLAAQILEGCMPFFVIKREQAEIAIAFQKTKTYHNGGGKRGTRIPVNVIQMREQMAHEVRQLKHVNYEIKEAVNG
jgi:hypothetical protein